MKLFEGNVLANVARWDSRDVKAQLFIQVNDKEDMMDAVISAANNVYTNHHNNRT